MKRFNVILCATLALSTLMVLVRPARAQQCDEDVWGQVAPDPWWSLPANWSGDVPDDDQIAVFDTSSDTLMDLVGDSSWPSGQPWVICSWVIEYDGASEVAFGAFDADDAEYATALSTLGDVSVDPSDYSNLLNLYTINVGQLDGLFVGDGMWDHEPVVDAETFGIKWNLLGTETGNDKAIVGVTGKIGGGAWTASRAGIVVLLARELLWVLER